MKEGLSIIIPVRNEKDSLSLMIRLMISSLNFQHEILVIYDSEDDDSCGVTKDISEKYDNVRGILNSTQQGVKFAISKGIEESKYNLVLVTAIDEIFPILEINEMRNLILEKDYDLVSGTRYKNGGKRYGGSFVGGIISRLANFLFRFLTNFPLSDQTTGIKMFKKKLWEEVGLNNNSVGWSFALELSIKSYLINKKITEHPIKSVDRLFGGNSTFKLTKWLKDYSKWFFWGLYKIWIKNFK